MAGQDLTKPQALRVPLLVLMLFTADLSTDGGRHAVSDVGHDPGMIDVIAHPRTGSTQDGIRIQVGVATLCSDAATFIDETIHSLFDALKVAVPDDTVGAIVATIWDWIVDQGEAFVRTLVSAVTDVVLATIRAIAGGIAAVANEVAALVPYVVKVRAEPGDTIALGPGRILGVFIATVTAGDLPDWPDVMKDCASRAQVALPSFRGRNEPVTWGAPVTDAGTLLSPGTFESVTDGNGEARWTFLTKPDPGAAPGQLRNAAIKVDLTVHRAELDDAKQRLADALFSGIPSLLRGFVDEVFGFFIDPLQSAVAALIDTPATGSVTLEYHEAPPPTPSPSASPSAPADIAGTWHGAWASQGYVGLSGGFTLTFIRNGTKLSGDIEISGSRCISTATISGTLNGQKIAFGAVEGGETIGYEGVWNGEAMAGSWTVTRASGGPCTNDGGSWQARR